MKTRFARFGYCLAVVTAMSVEISGAESKPDGFAWTDIRELGVEGRAFDDTKDFYDRLPARAEKTVRSAVWGLSRHSAGMAVRFVTDATTLKARWTLTSAKLEMVHMPATGVSGLDLYAKDADGKWKWVNVARPTKASNEFTLFSSIPAGKREFLLYLPLYNGVKSVALGVPSNSWISKAPEYPARKEKPIVFYGTSITHGACASRPGMCHPAIIGRRFGHPVVNLGFSGNGKMELEVGRFIAEIDAAVYVLDCLPNIAAKEVTERTVPFVRFLREKRPDTPILLVEDRNYADSWLVTSKRNRNETSQAALKAEFKKLKAAGVKHLYYLEGEKLIGDDTEGTVDSSHPNDLGFWRQANAFESVLKTIPGL